MLKFKLTSFDVLYFGSGRPFNVNVQEAYSIFPPLPPTLAGAICNKICVEKKIEISKIINNFYGPFLEKNGELLFPKPLNILIEKKKKDGEISSVELKNKNNFKLINPSYTDCNELKGLLWESERGKVFEVFESFLKIKGLKKWLNNQEIKKEDIVFKSEIFDFEPRIGIKMDNSRNITKEEDALYRIDFVRLKEGVNLSFFVEFNFEDGELKKAQLDDEDKIYEFFVKSLKVLKVGGEMKSASYECEKINKSIEDILGIKRHEIALGEDIKILYLTPGFLEVPSNLKFLTGVIRGTNLVMKSKNYGNNKRLRKGIVAGSVIYARVENINNLDQIWLKPKDGDFIGTNLRIYAKV